MHVKALVVACCGSCSYFRTTHYRTNISEEFKEKFMLSRTSILLALVLILVGLPVDAASAEGMPSLDLPPGIEEQAQPLLLAMMERMQDSGMSPEMMMLMMQDMQTMVDVLPPGIFLQLLELMPQLDMADMMFLHQQMHQGDLLQQLPGQILLFVKNLVD
jgi:hypothetical protein